MVTTNSHYLAQCNFELGSERVQAWSKITQHGKMGYWGTLRVRHTCSPLTCVPLMTWSTARCLMTPCVLDTWHVYSPWSGSSTRITTRAWPSMAVTSRALLARGLLSLSHVTRGLGLPAAAHSITALSPTRAVLSRIEPTNLGLSGWTKGNKTVNSQSISLKPRTPRKYEVDVTSIGQRSSPWTCNSVKVEIKFHLECKLHFPSAQLMLRKCIKSIQRTHLKVSRLSIEFLGEV